MAVIKVTNSKATLSKAISYITKDEKTEERLISGVNCNSETALDEMMATKEQFNKLEGRQYYHYVQSFSTEDNIDHQKAHRIALELAESRFNGFEVLIATHKDKDHVHSHIIVNSVSCENGLKFQSSKKDLAELKKASDKICEREGLSVIEKVDKDVLSSFNQKKYKTLEKAIEGSQKSYLLDLWRDCSQSLSKATSKEQFIKDMEQKGYGVNWVDTRKNITFITPEGKKVRNTNLEKTFKNEKFTKEGIENEIKRNRENARDRAEGNSAFGYEGISDLDKEFERRADSLEQQINKDHRLNRERERAIQEQRENKRREEQGTKRENTRSLQDNDKEIRGTERASSREVRKGFEGSRKYKEISHGNDESIKSDSISSRENRQTELEGQSKTIYNSNGNNVRSNTDNPRIIPVNKPNKVRAWDMER